MHRSTLGVRWCAGPVGVLAGMMIVPEARATFHFMQIEQVIAGVDGDVTAQAIQLRMRAAAQDQVSEGRLVAWDAAGLNPVVLVDFETNVVISAVGDRVLAASPGFARYSDPEAAPDFVMANVIPASYLSAGSLTFETDDGVFIVWRLSWGGAGYTGSTGGAFTNDPGGEFGPAFPDALPTQSRSALLFKGNAVAMSTNNAADYEVTAGDAVFVNNMRTSFAVVGFACPAESAGDADSDAVCDEDDNCPDDANGDQGDGDGDGAGDAGDACPLDGEQQEPGACGCGVADVDGDGDGTADCNDACPADAGKTSAGACGCGVSDDDGDGDGTADCNDACPADAAKTSAGACGCGQSDEDANGNGVADCLDPVDGGPGSGGAGCAPGLHVAATFSCLLLLGAATARRRCGEAA